MSERDEKEQMCRNGISKTRVLLNPFMVQIKEQHQDKEEVYEYVGGCNTCVLL